jgi:hypothetical protein
MLLALMMIVSSPAPALKTSIPPLPVRVSLPAPATKISSLLLLLAQAQAALLSMVSQHMIIVASQSPAQGMSTAMA